MLTVSVASRDPTTNSATNLGPKAVPRPSIAERRPSSKEDERRRQERRGEKRRGGGGGEERLVSESEWGALARSYIPVPGLLSLNHRLKPHSSQSEIRYIQSYTSLNYISCPGATQRCATLPLHCSPTTEKQRLTPPRSPPISSAPEPPQNEAPRAQQSDFRTAKSKCAPSIFACLAETGCSYVNT